MPVRKRSWVSPDGSRKEAWIAVYTDRAGDTHIKTFARKRDAEVYHVRVSIEVNDGRHTADSKSITVAEAGALWLKTSEDEGLERSSLDSYRQHVELHINPLIGNTKLSQLTVPMVRQFGDDLRAAGRSLAMARRAVRSLGAILTDAMERGHVAQNVVRSLRTRRKRGKQHRADKRQRGKLKVGVHIPAPDEIRTLIHAPR